MEYVKEVKTIKNLKQLKARTFVLRWNITSLCNYNCDFCIQGDREKHIRNAMGESRELRMKVSKNISGFLNRELMDNYKTVRVFLIGGEVTILQEFPEIIQDIINCGYPGTIEIYITSNMSASVEYWQRILRVLYQYSGSGVRKLHVSCSYYKAYTDIGTFSQKIKALVSYTPEQPIEKGFLRKMRAILQQKEKAANLNLLSIGIGIPLANSEDFAIYQEMKNLFCTPGISVNPIVLRDYPIQISEEIRQEILKESYKKGNTEVEFVSGEKKIYRGIQDMAFDLNGRGIFDPEGYFCDAGWNSITITNLGKVVRCPHTVKLSDLGSMVTGEVDLLQKMECCISHRCACNYFQIITKDETVIEMSKAGKKDEQHSILY